MSSHYQGGFFLLNVDERLNSEELGKSSWSMSFNNLFQKAFSYLCPALKPHHLFEGDEAQLWQFR